MNEFPLPHIVDHPNDRLWIKATYAESARIPLYVQQFYPGYSWHLANQELFDSLLESYQI